jgi:tripartite-type tricarboxylate transporter receptor subunit TctC
VVTSWNALYGPKETPQQAINVIAQATTEILQRPDVIAQYRAIGFDARPIATGPLDRRMRLEIDRWAKVIEQAGISKQ